VEQLRQAVQTEDWAGLFEDGKTLLQVQASWAAGPERCAMLQSLCEEVHAERVLEVGSFCGVASLAMAESLPGGVEVLAMELDPFLVEYGAAFRWKSPAGHKVFTAVGPAQHSLERLAEQARAGSSKPFDLVVIDADKAGMPGYLRIIWDTPGLLSDRAVVCVDTTPFKGQPPKRYVRFGQAERWVVNSGQAEIDALRADVAATEGITGMEGDGLLVIRRS